MFVAVYSVLLSTAIIVTVAVTTATRLKSDKEGEKPMAAEGKGGWGDGTAAIQLANKTILFLMLLLHFPGPSVSNVTFQGHFKEYWALGKTSVVFASTHDFFYKK
jgi:hypothetical protein